MIFKISTKSNPNSVAGAIVSMLKENKEVSLTCIGAGAVNQAIKSIVIARSFTISTGIDLTISPSFEIIQGQNEKITGICLKINKKEC